MAQWTTSYSWNQIKTELHNLSTKTNSKDDVLKFIAAPVRLEFLTALAIKSKMPAVRVIPNYRCDDTGLPTSTAGGNQGDIECYEQSHGILVEVTMAMGRTQTMMEISPIARHLGDLLKRCEAQCIFIAPSIYNDSVDQIEFIAMKSNGEKVIRPYSIDNLILYLEQHNILYDNSIQSLADNSEVKEYADKLLTTFEEMTILSLVRYMIDKFGEKYALMNSKDWYKASRNYVCRRTRQYKLQDNDPIMWTIAAESTGTYNETNNVHSTN